LRSVRHFPQGRMKNQAFLEFDSVSAAAAALDRLHGLVVHGKPLVVVRSLRSLSSLSIFNDSFCRQSFRKASSSAAS
jgi:RNA recognition motif-containing protein